MRCQRCGKPISPLRQLTDRNFCSDEHRKRGPLASASALRDYDTTDDLGWQKDESKSRAGGKMATSLALVMLLMVAGLVAARLYLPEGRVGGISPLAMALPDASPMLNGDGNRGVPPGDGPSVRLMNWIEDRLPGDKPIRTRSEFAKGFDTWTTELRTTGRSVAWSARGGAAQPGTLRLWKPTLHSRDYDLRFLGEIERRSMNWTYRATDSENYYATKLTIGKPGTEQTAKLTRMVVHGARTISKLELPMPVTLYTDRPYHVTVAVRGNHFLTLLDGHIIDDWSDNTLAAGGVGFFSDAGESSTIHWVDFRERKGLLSKFFTTALLMPAPMVFDPLP